MFCKCCRSRQSRLKHQATLWCILTPFWGTPWALPFVPLVLCIFFCCLSLLAMCAIHLWEKTLHLWQTNMIEGRHIFNFKKKIKTNQTKEISPWTRNRAGLIAESGRFFLAVSALNNTCSCVLQKRWQRRKNLMFKENFSLTFTSMLAIWCRYYYYYYYYY